MIKNIDQILTRLGYFYLILPFFIFSATWLAIPFAVITTLIVSISYYYSIRNIKNDQATTQLLIQNKKPYIYFAILLLILIFFSGIGSYSYQSNDFLYRNAILRDLINFDWPVLYKIHGFEGNALNDKTTMMTYYIGFFLPAAIFGKFFGLASAQLFLFLWSFLGLILCIYQCCKYLKRFNYKVLLLFFSWGTLFFVGALYKYGLAEIFTNKNFLWAGMVLYAESNLGGIYWIFNQVLTAWLIILLIFNNESKLNLIFIYTLCLFLSPFSFVGLFPFVLNYFFQNYQGRILKFNDLVNNLKSYLSFQNIFGGFVILFFSYLYLTSNQASNIFRVLHHKPKIIFAFILLSWGIMALLILPKYKKNSTFWCVVAVLTPLPFFQLGNGIDFPGRISLPAMFILMLLVGKHLIEIKSKWQRMPIISILILSGVWHFSTNVGLSTYYTILQTLSHHSHVEFALNKTSSFNNWGRILLKLKNKDILTKDFITLDNPKNDIIGNYMSDTEKSKFYKYFAKKPN